MPLAMEEGGGPASPFAGSRPHDKPPQAPEVSPPPVAGGSGPPLSPSTAGKLYGHMTEGPRVMRKADGPAGEAQIPRGEGEPVSGEVRSRVEPPLGHDVSHARVHTGAESSAAAGKLGAKAFTVGHDIHFGEGQMAPGTPQGDHLLAHELTHVVQQGPGLHKKADKVSDPGESAEVEADRAADHVTGALHGGGDGGPAAISPAGGGGKVFRYGREATQVGDVTWGKPGRETTVRDAAVNFGQTADPEDPDFASKSKAKNPQFEQHAMRFEGKLGGLAYGKAAGTAASLCGKAKGYLEAKIDKKTPVDAEKELSKLLADCGFAEASVAGAVGQDPMIVGELVGMKQRLADLRAQVAGTGQTAEKVDAKQPANLREQMTFLFGFAKLLASDVAGAAAKNDTTEMQRLLGGASADLTALRARIARLREMQAEREKQAGNPVPGATTPLKISATDAQYSTPAPRADKVNEYGDAADSQAAMKQRQELSRVNRGAAEVQEQKNQGLPEHYRGANTDTRSQRTEDDLKKETGNADIGLSDREKAVKGSSHDGGKMGWAEGGRDWAVNENDKWVKAQRELSMPLVAGPSGSTNNLMNAGTILGAGPDEMRAACIGYLLPIHAHSLTEVCAAASAYGPAFTPGPQLYKTLQGGGLDTDAILQHCGRDGAGGQKLYPDDPDPGQPVAQAGETHDAPVQPTVPTPSPGTPSPDAMQGPTDTPTPVPETNIQ